MRSDSGLLAGSSGVAVEHQLVGGRLEPVDGELIYQEAETCTSCYRWLRRHPERVDPVDIRHTMLNPVERRRAQRARRRTADGLGRGSQAAEPPHTR